MGRAVEVEVEEKVEVGACRFCCVEVGKKEREEGEGGRGGGFKY